MDSTQVAVAIAVQAAGTLTLAGLVLRGRARQCWSFVAYLCALFLTDSMWLHWPERFYTADFWVVRQALVDILKTVVALEMAWRVVRAFPGALRTARLWALTLLIGSVLLLGSASRPAEYGKVLFTWQPRVVACTALLFTLTALLVAWYHLPMRRLHRAIMGGFTVYLAFFATALSIFKRPGFERQVWFGLDAWFLVSLLDTLVFFGITLHWMAASWAPTEEAMPAPLVVEPVAVPELAGRAA